MSDLAEFDSLYLLNLLQSWMRTAWKSLFPSNRSLLTSRPSYIARTARTMASASVSNPSEFTTPVNKTAHAFDKTVLDALLARRFFYAPAFEIYGGTHSQTNRKIC